MEQQTASERPAPLEPWFFDENPAVTKFASERRNYDTEASLESFFFRAPCNREVNNQANEKFMRMLRKDWAELSPSRRTKNETQQGFTTYHYTPTSWKSKIPSEVTLPGQPVTSSSPTTQYTSRPKHKNPLEADSIAKTLQFEPGTSLPKRILSPGRLPKYLRKLKARSNVKSEEDPLVQIRKPNEIVNTRELPGLPNRSRFTVKSALKLKSAFDSPTNARVKSKGISWEIPVSHLNQPTKKVTQEELESKIKEYLEDGRNSVSPLRDPHVILPPVVQEPSSKTRQFQSLPGCSSVLAEAHMRGSRIPVLAAHFQPDGSLLQDQLNHSSGNVSSHDSGFSESTQEQNSARKKVISKKKSPTRRTSATRSKYSTSRKLSPGSRVKAVLLPVVERNRGVKKSFTGMKSEKRDSKSPIAARRKGHKQLDQRREAAKNIYHWFVNRWSVMPSLRMEQVDAFKEIGPPSSQSSISDISPSHSTRIASSNRDEDPKVQVIMDHMTELRLNTPQRPYSVAVSGRNEVIATELSSHFAKDWLKVEDTLNNLISEEQGKEKAEAARKKQNIYGSKPKKSDSTKSRSKQTTPKRDVQTSCSEPAPRKDKSIQCHLDSPLLTKAPNLQLRRRSRPRGSCHSAPSCAPEGEMIPDWDIHSRNSGSQTDAYLIEHSLYTRQLYYQDNNEDADISGSVSLENIPEDFNSGSTWDDTKQSLLSSCTWSEDGSVEDLFEIRVSRKKKGFLDLNQISPQRSFEEPLPIINHPFEMTKRKQQTKCIVVEKGLPLLRTKGGRKLSDSIDLTVQKVHGNGVQVNIHSLPDICMHLTINPVARDHGTPERRGRRRFGSVDGVSMTGSKNELGLEQKRVLPASAEPAEAKYASNKARQRMARISTIGQLNASQLDGLELPADEGDGSYPTALWIRKVNIMRKKPPKKMDG